MADLYPNDIYLFCGGARALMGKGEGKIATGRFRSNITFARDFFFVGFYCRAAVMDGFFAGIFAGRRNMTVILTFEPQFTERAVQISHIVFPRISHYGSTTLQANEKEITHRTNALAH